MKSQTPSEFAKVSDHAQTEILLLSNVYIPSIQLGQGRTWIKDRIFTSLKYVGEFSTPMRTG